MSRLNRPLFLAACTFVAVALALAVLGRTRYYMRIRRFIVGKPRHRVIYKPQIAEHLTRTAAGWESTVIVKNPDDDVYYVVDLKSLTYEGQPAIGLPVSAEIAPHVAKSWKFIVPGLRVEPRSSLFDFDWENDSGESEGVTRYDRDRIPWLRTVTGAVD